MQRFVLTICAVLAFTIGPAFSEPHPLAGVGRLESAQKSGCSGVLIEPDVVLTAAHCVNNFSASYVFHTGAYPGTPPTTQVVEAVAPHPVFLLGIGGRRAQLRVDLALVRLAEPILPDQAQPIPVGERPEVGEVFHVASYPAAQGNRPRERRCESFQSTKGLLSLGCPVIGGESGAPVLRLTPDGPQVAAILTARTSTETQPIGLAVTPTDHMRTLNDALAEAEPLSADGS